MIARRIYQYFLVCVAAFAVATFVFDGVFRKWALSQEQSNSAASSEKIDERKVDANSPSLVPNQPRPVIIWFHNIATTKPKVLEKAIKNGIISHALLLYLHPLDSPIEGQVLKKVKKAVDVCKKYKVKIIWCRTLWPTYEVRGFRRSDFFDPRYYVEAIEKIRFEAKVIGVELTCVDNEPYGYFPFKSEFGKSWTKKNFNAITGAVKEAVSKTGQVDFVLPSYAAAVFPNHPYNALVELGKWKIAEHTYFDIPKKIMDKKRPYDVLGAYVNISKKNVKVPSAPFFTLEEILQRQELWAHKKGLMLYPYEGNVEQIAEMLSKISDVQPKTTKKSGR